jgi:hypothetical protein
MLLSAIFQSQRPRRKKDKRAKPVDPRLGVPPITVVGTASTSPVSMSASTRLSPIAKHRPTASRVAHRQEEAVERARRERMYRLTHVVHSQNFHEQLPLEAPCCCSLPSPHAIGAAEALSVLSDSDEPFSPGGAEDRHLGVRSEAIKRFGVEFGAAAPRRVRTVPKVKLPQHLEATPLAVPPTSALGETHPTPLRHPGLDRAVGQRPTRPLLSQTAPLESLEVVLARRAVEKALNTSGTIALDGDLDAACRSALLRLLPERDASRLAIDPVERLVAEAQAYQRHSGGRGSAAPDVLELRFADRRQLRLASLGGGVDESFTAGEVRLLTSIFSRKAAL